MTLRESVSELLTAWLRTQLPDADHVAVEGLDRLTFGHSAEMMVLTIVATRGDIDCCRDVVVRLRPKPPGLLEPNDLSRQFRILRALEGTTVRAPKALWIEESGDVLGRPFFVMERVEGTVYEMETPDVDAATVERMCRGLVEQIAAIHAVDLDATGLAELNSAGDYLGDELDHWAAEMRRVAHGALPALERLLQGLRDAKPDPYPRATLVHGDAKPGNVAFVAGDVSAVFDWEMSTVGDPLTDIGWLEMLWRQPVGITSHPAALPVDELVAHYEAVSGITTRHREWYRAFNAYKMAVICLIGSMLVDGGVSDDDKLLLSAYGVGLLTKMGLSELGINEDLDDGPVLPREERIQQVLASSGGGG